jgi:hypothetical protein
MSDASLTSQVTKWIVSLIQRMDLHDAKYNSSGPSELSLSPSLPSTQLAPPISLSSLRLSDPASDTIHRTNATFSFLSTIIQGHFHLIMFFLPGPNDNGYDVVSAHGPCLSCCNTH